MCGGQQGGSAFRTWRWELLTSSTHTYLHSELLPSFSHLNPWVWFLGSVLLLTSKCLEATHTYCLSQAPLPTSHRLHTFLRFIGLFLHDVKESDEGQVRCQGLCRWGQSQELDQISDSKSSFLLCLCIPLHTLWLHILSFPSSSLPSPPMIVIIIHILFLYNHPCSHYSITFFPFQQLSKLLNSKRRVDIWEGILILIP